MLKLLVNLHIADHHPLILGRSLQKLSMHLQMQTGTPQGAGRHWREMRLYLCYSYFLEIFPKSSSGSCLLGTETVDGISTRTGANLDLVNLTS